MPKSFESGAIASPEAPTNKYQNLEDKLKDLQSNPSATAEDFDALAREAGAIVLNQKVSADEEALLNNVYRLANYAKNVQREKQQSEKAPAVEMTSLPEQFEQSAHRLVDATSRTTVDQQLFQLGYESKMEGKTFAIDQFPGKDKAEQTSYFLVGSGRVGVKDWGSASVQRLHDQMTDFLHNNENVIQGEGTVEFTPRDPKSQIREFETALSSLNEIIANVENLLSETGEIGESTQAELNKYLKGAELAKGLLQTNLDQFKTQIDARKTTVGADQGGGYNIASTDAPEYERFVRAMSAKLGTVGYTMNDLKRRIERGNSRY